MTTFVKQGEKLVEVDQPKVAGVSGTYSPESPAKKNPAPTHNDFTGKYNPSYVLCRDYNGHVYAKYVGPFYGYVEWDIWVPKILVTNAKGPIQKWVPKTKQ